MTEEPSERDYWLGITARKRGGQRMDPAKKKVQVVFCLTPWFLKAVAWVQDQEEARTGKKPNKSIVIRGLAQMGLDVYRKLMTLPENER